MSRADGLDRHPVQRRPLAAMQLELAAEQLDDDPDGAACSIGRALAGLPAELRDEAIQHAAVLSAAEGES